MGRRASAGQSGVPARIRSYRKSDLDACRKLWAELTLWHRRIYDDTTIGGSDPGSHFDAYIGKNGTGRIWVALVDNVVVGMAGLISGDEGLELEPLIVNEEYRRRGIGQMLSKKVIQAAINDSARTVSVRPVARNDPAIRFFHARGFDTLGHIEMFIDLTPAARQKWKEKLRIAGRNFRF